MLLSDLPSCSSNQLAVSDSIVAGVAPEERERMLSGRSFRFHHNLGEHPSMTLPAVRSLVERMLAEKRFDQIFYKTHKSSASGRYSDSNNSKALIEKLGNFSSAGVWLRLTRVDEVTEEFNEHVEDFIENLSDLYQEDIRSRTLRTFLTLFVSSPGTYTNYHMDHTWNFLLQISGQKTVHLYDPHDSEVLTPEDKEAWYMKEFAIVPRALEKDMQYPLGPGDGVHHPVNAPHWVQNGDDISVSLSIGLCLHESNREAKIHQANYLLRKFGLRPRPPRISTWRDSLKASFVSLWSDRNTDSLNGAVFSGGSRLKNLLRAGPQDPNQYEPK